MAAQQLGATHRAFCEKVRGANLPLSRHKTKALATSKELRQALMQQPCRDLGPDEFVGMHRDLGGGAISGSHRRVTTAAARELQARAQGRKLTGLFRPGLDRARVYRAGPAAKATRGSAIMGVPNGRLRQLRVGAIKARGPLTIATRTALMAYVEVIWASLLPEAAARPCLARGTELAQQRHPWRQVKDPISALVLTLDRVGWGFLQGDPYLVHDSTGAAYDVRRHSPTFFGSLVALQCRVAIGLEEVARQSPSMWGWCIPPFWQPILDMASHRSQVWDQHHQRALRSLIQNTYWCQARVAAADSSRAAPSNCQLCGFKDGSLFHRRFRCEAHGARRRDCLEKPLRGAADRVEGLGFPFTDLFARGLFPDISEFMNRPVRPEADYFESSTSWYTLGPHLNGHHVFVDGSGLDQACPRLRTAGWSAVIYDEAYRRVAEDYAVKVLTSQVAGGSYRLYIDCMATARCAANPSAAAAASGQRAHLRAGQAEQLQDVTVAKVRAHQGPKAVVDGLVSQFELGGNARADRRAKQDATAARANLGDTLVVEGCLSLARLAARFAAAHEVQLSRTSMLDSMGVVALRLIDLGEWPQWPAEFEDEGGDVEGEAAASSQAPGGSAPSEPDAAPAGLQPWRVAGHALLAAPILLMKRRV
ncbi:unnamed protein product, partial [Prorocentrum cordatum]